MHTRRFIRRLVGRLVDRVADRLAERLIGRLADRLTGRLVGQVRQFSKRQVASAQKLIKSSLIKSCFSMGDLIILI